MNRAFYTIEGITARVSITDHPERVQPVVTVVTPEPVESYEHAIIEASPEGARVENLFTDPAPLHDEFFDSAEVADVVPDVQMVLDKEDSMAVSDSLKSVDYNKTVDPDSVLLSGVFVLSMSYNEYFISEDQILSDSGVVVLTKEASGLIGGAQINSKILNGVIVEQGLF